MNRINNVYVTLKGFLENEAPKIQTMGDPSIQLPLATARSDMSRLNDELLVLKRNPGLQSSLTVDDVNSIEANMGYLQKKWRLSANSIVEPFQTARKGFLGLFSDWFSSEPFQNQMDISGEEFEEEVEEEVEREEESNIDPPANEDNPISLNDLKDLSSRIAVETVRLNSSGSTDPLIKGRISTLTEIKNRVDDMVSQVEQGYKKIEDVPLTKSDIATFLPLMANLNNPVPQILNSTGMNPVLQNLFQTYSGGDMGGAKDAMAMFDKYASMLLNNMSWEFNVNYMGKAEQDATKQDADSIASLASLLQGSTVLEFDEAPDSSYGGQMQALTRAMSSPGTVASSTSSKATPTQNLDNLPTPYDWKPRTTQICQQIAARGMTPSEFGCVDPESVSENFSWRGNAKMVCSRLTTLYDPSVPEACGCPPTGWPGWRA